MQKITPHLWYNDQAEEAANLYVSVFPNSKINEISKYPESAEEVSGRPAGSVMTVHFTLDGQDFMALNGGPVFQFSEAISFMVSCSTQEEIDELWGKLSAHPESEQCGWLKDKFGLSWQIVPKQLGEMMSDSDKSKVERVTAAFLKMKKFNISELEKAYNQE